MLETLKIRLNADEGEHVLTEESFLTACLDSATKQVARYCSIDSTKAKTDLDDVIIEIALIIVRKFRAEGVKSESLDITNTSYIVDVLEPFYPQLNKYNDSKKSVTDGAWLIC